MPTPAEAIERLVAIMSRLRGPDGCPWDREQTLSSLRPYVLEETYEVLEAIDAGDPREHCEELAELDAAIESGDRAEIEHELGDALFALVNVARKLGHPLEEALRASVGRFIDRFEHVERGLERAGIPHGEATLEQMDGLWEEAKSLSRQNKKPR